MVGGKYNKWIIILQVFDLEFVSAKSEKSLIFAELISGFPSLEEEEVYEDTIRGILGSKMGLLRKIIK